MIRDLIGFILPNLPGFLIAAALIVAAIGRKPASFAERFLDWLLLLPIGITGLWAGISHIAFPSTSAAYIGWAPSPFQFEVGMADLAIGVTACIAFRRDLAFKAAAICAAAIFLLGDAIGHVRQMAEAGNFAPGNAGTPFYADIVCPVLAIILWAIAKRGAPSRG